MASDVVLRVRLDTAPASADLDALYRRMGNAPGVRAGGGGGYGPGGGGGGGGGGGFGLGSTLGTLAKASPIVAALAAGAMVVGPTLGTAYAVGQSTLGAFGSQVERGIFGDTSARMSGRNRANTEVQGHLGLAVGLGVADLDMAKSLRDAIQPMRVAEDVGRDRIKDALDWDAAGETMKDVFGQLIRAINSLAGKGSG